MFYCFYNHIKNKYFDDMITLSPEKREAEIFKKTCEEIPLFIKDDDLIAGWYGCENADFHSAYEDKFFPFFDSYTKEEKEIKNYLEQKFGITIRFDKGHTAINYGNIISDGLVSYEEKIRKELKKDNTASKKNMLEAMLTSVSAVNIYAGRYASLADEIYAKNKNPHMLKIKNALEKVPYYPCENIFEAISALWIMHCLVPISENAWPSISLGRVDQFLYPLYKKSLKNGETRENVKAYLKNLFVLLNSYGDAACALNIGGTDKNGNDLMNELSELLIEVEKELLLPSPIFAVRLNPDTPEDIIDKCIDLKLFSIGQPTFYGELTCRNALLNRGIPFDKAVDFSVNSCMGLYISGEEIASMWGCVFNMHLPLELAINNGKGIFYDLPFEICKTEIPDNLDILLENYQKYLKELLTVSFKFNRKNAENCALNTPNPLLSAITASCLESGKDRATGALYNTETIETMALANTVNAICAIDTLVFKEQKCTLEQLITATKNNFEGYEEILSRIKACEKYGTNSKYADSIATKIVEMTYKICKEASYDNVYFVPSLHTLDSNVHFGANLYTTLDGRLKGSPVAKNAGPTNDARTPDPTSLIISAASIKQDLFSGGQPIDLYFDKSTLETKEKRDKIKALIKTYFELGGMQLQVNSPDIELLEKAYETPENYPQLVVRIGGYSCKFTELSKNVQKEFIERFRMEK